MTVTDIPNWLCLSYVLFKLIPLFDRLEFIADCGPVPKGLRTCLENGGEGRGLAPEPRRCFPGRRCLSPSLVEGCSNSGDRHLRGEKHAAPEPVPYRSYLENRRKQARANAYKCSCFHSSWVSRRLMSRVLVVLLALAAIVAAGCQGRGRPDANAPRKVVVYCSVDPEFAVGILAAFEKQTGVKAVVRYDEEATKTTGLVQRLRAEADYPAADVLWSSECFQTIALANEGILAPYRGPAAKGWPAQFADPNGRWHAFGLRMRVVAWNTKRVKPADAPRKIEDLLDAKFKGRLVMADPRFGTTGGDVASWFAHYGPVRAREMLRGLTANGVRQVQGNSTAVRAVWLGEADVCLTDADDVFRAQRDGWSIAMAPLDQGGAGALAIPNTVALVKGAGNQAEAGELIEFLLSEQVERMMAASESRNIPIRPVLAAEYPKNAIGKPLELDYRKIAAQRPAALAAVKEIMP